MGLGAASNDVLAQNPAAGLDALKTSFEQLAASIAGPGVQALGPSLATMAQEVQKASATIGGLNPNLVALGAGAAAIAGTVGGLKAMFGVGGSLFGLKGSAIALDKSAADLSAAAAALSGRAGSPGGGSAPGMPSLTGKVTLGALTGAGLLVNAPTTDGGIGDNANGFNEWWKSTQLGKAADSIFGAAPTWVGSRGNSGPHPAPGPAGGHSSIDAAKASADAAAGALDQLNQVAHPEVDSSSIRAALGLAMQLRATLDSINGAALGAAASIPTRLPPSLGSTQRGNFSFGGVNGE
jgi:hypothetical protein